MPLLSLTTNTSPPGEKQEEILNTLSRNTATMLGKSENYVMVKAEFSARMVFAGSPEPAAYIELKSIGLPEERTAELSAMLCTALAELLELPAQRIYIEFSNAQRHMWGWNARTFG